MEDFSKFRKFRVGNWASFKNVTMNWEKGKITKVIPESDGHIDFTAYVYDSIESGQLRDLKSQEVDSIPLTPNLLPDLGFEKMDDITYKKGEWELTFQFPEDYGPVRTPDDIVRTAMKNNYFSLTDGHKSYPTVSEVHTLQNIIGSR